MMDYDREKIFWILSFQISFNAVYQLFASNGEQSINKAQFEGLAWEDPEAGIAKVD